MARYHQDTVSFQFFIFWTVMKHFISWREVHVLRSGGRRTQMAEVWYILQRGVCLDWCVAWLQSTSLRLPPLPRLIADRRRGGQMGPYHRQFTRTSPAPVVLICGRVSALWLVSWYPLGWKALVASSQIYQDWTRLKNWRKGQEINICMGVLRNVAINNLEYILWQSAYESRAQINVNPGKCRVFSHGGEWWLRG